jgi:hypothetical protein
MRHGLVLIFAAAIGCAHPPVRQTGQLPALACPAHQGGPAWEEIESPHFVVRTDWDLVTARRTVDRLERTRATWVAVAASLLPDRPPPDEKVLISLFRRKIDFQAVGTPWHSGLFRYSIGDPVIIATGDGSWSASHLLQHELAHSFLAHYWLDLPAWLSEGLAEYAASFFLLGKEGVFGAAPERWAFFAATPRTFNPIATYVPVDRLPRVREVLQSPGLTFRFDLHYAVAWGLVHWLLDHDPNLVRSWISRVAAGDPAGSVLEDAAANLETLDGGLHAFLTEKHVATWHVPAAAVGEIPIRSRPLTDEEVHLWWARLSTPRGAAAVEAQLERAHPDAPERLLLEAEIRLWAKDEVGMLEKARRALSARPELEAARDVVVVHELDARLKRLEPDRHLEELEPLVSPLERSTNEDTLNLAAWYWAQRSLPERGLPVARRAVQRCPGCFAALDTLALLLWQSGDHAQALATEERAARLMTAAGQNEPEILERLDQFRRGH